MKAGILAENKRTMLHNFTKKPTHFDIGYAPVHISYRLYGSVPVIQLQSITDRRDEQIEQLLAAQCDRQHKLAPKELKLEMHRINQRYDLAIDEYLHNSSNGPYYLSDSRIANEVIDSWKYLHDEGFIYLYAICVMSNHVHVIIGNANPKAPTAIDLLMQRTKRFTSRAANKLLGRTGEPFWSEKYYDVTIRKGRFMRAMWYVLNNPVKAGLVKFWADWPNTYVHPEYVGLFARQNGAASPVA